MELHNLKEKFTVIFLGDSTQPTKLVLLKRSADRKFAPNLYSGLGGKIGDQEEFKDETRVVHRQMHNAKKILEEALSRLSETQRSLVMLKDYEGYSYEEIGKITGLNESQVKVYLHRARVQLKNYLVKPENVI